MANSFVRYTGDGATTTYSIPFSYRVAGDITVTIDGVASSAFTYNAAGTTITFNSPPANSTAIEIRRTTSQTSRLTDYASGSVLTESDLDTDSTQSFFMSQEAIDDAGDKIKIDSADFQWDATNKILYYVQEKYTNYGLDSSGNLTLFSGANAITGANSNAVHTPSTGTSGTTNGVVFASGYANPELSRDTGEVIYVENRRAISRASDQTEDIKVVVEF